MADDIEVVIKIPEERFRDIQRIAEVQLESNHFKTAEQIIAKGTPLPKGHGRMIDADAFQKYCFNKNFDKRLSDVGLAIINMFLEIQPTIIDADKEDDVEVWNGVHGQVVMPKGLFEKIYNEAEEEDNDI